MIDIDALKFSVDELVELATWMQKFCEHAGIKYQDPNWHLAARYF
jgi:hypothetical protein